MKNNVNSKYCNTCDRAIPTEILTVRPADPCPECGESLPTHLRHLAALPVKVETPEPSPEVAEKVVEMLLNPAPEALGVRPRSTTMPAVLGAPYKFEGRPNPSPALVTGYSGPSLKGPSGIPGESGLLKFAESAGWKVEDQDPPRGPYGFDEYQRASGATAVYPGQGTNAGISYLIHGLTGEAGEVANKFKKVLRDDNGILTRETVAKIREELGDQMWYMQQIDTELAKVFGETPSLENLAVKNRIKLMNRAEKGTLKGSGDNR